MADRIHASSEWLDKCARDLKSIESAISNAGSTLGSINLRRDEGGNLRTSLSCSLRMNGGHFSGNNAADDIRQLQRAAASLSSAAAGFSGGASNAARLFEKAEDTAVKIMRGVGGTSEAGIYDRDGGGDGTWPNIRIKEHASELLKKGINFTGGDDNKYGIPDHIDFGGLDFFSPFLFGQGKAKAGIDQMVLFGIPMGVSGAVLSGSVSSNQKLGFLDITHTAEGELFGYSTKVHDGKWKVSEKDGKISSDITFGAEGEVHLAKGKITQDINGVLHREINGTVGQVSAEGTAGLTLYKDGKLSPALQAKLKVEAVAAKGSIEDRIGTEDYNYHTKASGSVGVASAEATAGIGRITYKDANGTEHTAWGAQGKVGAEAYLAEGKVSGGFTIMGIKIDAGVSGKLGGAGASAGGQVTTSGVSGKLDLGLGAGLGVDISVDWSGFKPPKLPQIKLPELKMPKFKLW